MEREQLLQFLSPDFKSKMLQKQKDFLVEEILLENQQNCFAKKLDEVLVQSQKKRNESITKRQANLMTGDSSILKKEKLSTSP